jgi:hypothetical protein
MKWFGLVDVVITVHRQFIEHQQALASDTLVLVNIDVLRLLNITVLNRIVMSQHVKRRSAKEHDVSGYRSPKKLVKGIVSRDLHICFLVPFDRS